MIEVMMINMLVLKLRIERKRMVIKSVTEKKR